MKKSRLSKKNKTDLLSTLIAGITSRCAAGLIGVNRKTAAYYFHRLREIISYHVAREKGDFLRGEIEVAEFNLVENEKANVAVERLVKSPYLAFYNVVEEFITNVRSATSMPIIQD